MTQSGKAVVYAIPKILKIDGLEIVEFDERICSSVNRRYRYRGSFDGLPLVDPSAFSRGFKESFAEASICSQGSFEEKGFADSPKTLWTND